MSESSLSDGTIRIRWALVALFLGLGFIVLRPLIGAILWAIILTILFDPLHRWLLARLPKRQIIVPLSISLAAGLLIMGPLIWGLLEIQSEANLAYDKLSKDWSILTFNIPDQWVEIPIIGQWLHDAVAAIPLGTQSIILEFKDFIPLIGRGIGALLRGLSSQVLQLILTGITFFFLLKEGRVILASIRKGFDGVIGPSLDGYIETIRSTVYAVSFGLIGSAAAQGVIASLGYTLVGLETPLLLGIASALASLIPVLGASLVWGPIVMSLIIDHQTTTAIAVVLWGILAVHPTDNILRPLLIGHLLHYPIILVIFGVIGGILAFGLVGIFIGPCILVTLMKAWLQWSNISPSDKD
jgi:predicted PurR-regulated permease PerM